MHHQRRSDLATRHSLAHACKVRVEAPVESDLQLHACLLDSRQSRVNLLETERDRLLTKNVLPRLRRLRDQVRVRACRRADQHGIDRLVANDFLSRGRYFRNVAPLRQGRRCLAVNVGNRRDLCFGQPESQRLRMNLPDPSRSNDSEMKFLPAHTFPLRKNVSQSSALIFRTNCFRKTGLDVRIVLRKTVLKGHGFSRAVRIITIHATLATEGGFSLPLYRR